MEAAASVGILPQCSDASVQELKYFNGNNPIRLHNKLPASIQNTGSVFNSK